MRLLQLTTGAGLLDLHPQVSVVQGITPEDRTALYEAVAGLARHEAAGEGLLEAHGVLFQLDPALLALLEPRHHDLDPIVRPAQLPGHVAADPELTAREAAFRALLDRLAAAVEAQARCVVEVEQTAVELDRARAGLHAARTELAEVEASESAASVASDRARSELAMLVLLRDTLADRIDEASVDALLAAGERWRALHLSPPSPPAAPPEVAVDEDPAPAPGGQRRVVVIEHLLAELGAADPTPVRAALDAARAPRPTVPDGEAAALAVELLAIEADLAADAAAGVAELSDEDRAVLERVEAARAAVADAEDAARDLAVDPADAAELEAAHEALHAAIERADARLAGPRARRRVEQLREAEQAVLDRLGLVTYAEYLMGTSAAHRRPAAEVALQAARVELVAAEAAWDEVAERHAEVLAHAERRARRRTLIERARPLVGDRPEGEVVGALQELRADAPTDPTVGSRLASALDAVGVDVSDGELALEDLVVMAEAWLAEVDGARARAAQLEAERAALARPSAPAATVGDGDEVAIERAAASRALEDAERRHQAHRDALDALAAVERQLEPLRALTTGSSGEAPTDLHRARSLAEEAQRALASAEAAHESAVGRCDRLGDEVAALEAKGQLAAEALEQLQDERTARGQVALDRAEVEWYLMAKVAAQRASSVAGSTPLLVEDPFPGLDEADVHHLLDQLERLADSVQVILVSDAPHVAAWAEAAGEGRAAVVRPVLP